MIKDKNTFANLDEHFSGIIHNANKTRSRVLGKGDAEFFAKNNKEEWKKIVLKDAVFVPGNSKNLISVSKLRETGVDVSFGECCEVCELLSELISRKNSLFPMIARQEREKF